MPTIIPNNCVPTNKARHNSISKSSVLNSIKHSKNIFQSIPIMSSFKWTWRQSYITDHSNSANQFQSVETAAREEQQAKPTIHNYPPTIIHKIKKRDNPPFFSSIIRILRCGVSRPAPKCPNRVENRPSSPHLARRRVGASWYERPPKDFKKVAREGSFSSLPSPSAPRLSYLSLSLLLSPPLRALFPCRPTDIAERSR